MSTATRRQEHMTAKTIAKYVIRYYGLGWQTAPDDLRITFVDACILRAIMQAIVVDTSNLHAVRISVITELEARRYPLDNPDKLHAVLDCL